MPIIYLADFYAEMRLLRETRCKIISNIKSTQKPNHYDLRELNNIEGRLTSIKKNDSLFQLKTHQDDVIALELDYELGEIQKDKIFLEDGEDALLKHFEDIHPNFKNEVDKGVEFLKHQQFQHFITDRDGTISNYCGRYQSSVQSIYNALFLSNFAKNIEGNSIIITSAPLYNIGLADISVQPENDFILAGSKGRELIDENGQKHEYTIKEDQQQKLDELNSALKNLLKKDEYSSFRYIGSGLQLKFGQTTLARQDKNQSIPEKKSLNLKHEIRDLLKRLDPEKNYFRLEDTGKDLEMILTVETENKEFKEDFDKGDGFKFITDQLNIKTQNQKILICGDTASDLPMIERANDMQADVSSIFVTRDDSLKKEVKRLCEQSIIVSNPDILVTSLYLYSKTQ